MQASDVVIAGAGSLGKRLGDNVLETPWLGMRLCGFFDDQRRASVWGIEARHADH